MNVLGIHIGHDSGAALVQDGKIVAAQGTYCLQAGALPGSPIRGAAGCSFSPYDLPFGGTNPLEAVLAEPEPADSDDVCIEATQLRPGMVLARDLLSSKGALLLAAGYVFEERVIRQIREFVAGEGLRLTLHVRRPQLDAPRLTPPPLPQKTALSGEHHHA